MKRLIFTLVFPLLLTGCAATPQDQKNLYDNVPMRSDSGETWTVSSLKKDFMDRTGKELVAPGALDCQWNQECYYNAYAKAHDDGLKPYIEAQEKEQRREIAQETAACNASPDCRREKAISNASDSLNQQYQMVLAMNPYDQGDFDGAIRKVCRVAGESQRQGVSLDTMRENMRLAEGIDPQTRYAAIQVATACWILSENGVSDGTTKIRLPY